MIDPWNCETKLFCHVQLIRQYAVWKFPIKTMHKLCYNQPNHSQSQLNSWANSSSRSKRNKLEITSTDIDIATGEPFREELLCIAPRLRVSSNGPCTYNDSCIFRYVEAIDVAVFHRSMGEQQWCSWM